MAVRPLPEAAELRKFFRYDPDTGNLYRHDGNEPSGWKSSQGYVLSRISGKTWFAHRIIWKMMTGEDPETIDHINGDRCDNCWVNLRSVSRATNSKNRGVLASSTSGIFGVFWNKKRNCWQARIKRGGKDVHLGCFESKAEAITARRVAEKKYGFHPNHGHREAVARSTHNR